MKINLGSGYGRLDGYVNVDKDPLCLPDVLLTLDRDPWPWEDNSVDEALMDHVLEHLGETTDQYLHVIKELYRVCKPRAKIIIKVPHPRHDNFLQDCTHVRPITPEGLGMFCRRRNLQQIADGAKDTKLALMCDVDFEIVSVQYMLMPRWEIQVKNGLLSDAEMLGIMQSQNNICYEIMIELTAIKEQPGGIAAHHFEEDR